MTVQELREALSQLPPTALVVIAPENAGVVIAVRRLWVQSIEEAYKRGTFAKQHVCELAASLTSWRD